MADRSDRDRTGGILIQRCEIGWVVPCALLPGREQLREYAGVLFVTACAVSAAAGTFPAASRIGFGRHGVADRDRLPVCGEWSAA